MIAGVSLLVSLRAARKQGGGQVTTILPMTAIIALGVLLVTVVPSMYLGYIRRKKAAGSNVIVHRILFVLYWFPFVPWAFMACIFGALYFGGLLN